MPVISRPKGGSASGPSPVDRGRAGVKHHLIVDSRGTPLGWTVTGGNRNDVTQMLPLLDLIPTIRGGIGRPWRRPGMLYADRGYDHRPQRGAVSRRGIRLRIARRNTKNGSGLGRQRWPVEQTFALLHRYRRLATCYERTIETHAAFVALACCLICWRRHPAADVS
jgi:transposase